MCFNLIKERLQTFIIKTDVGSQIACEVEFQCAVEVIFTKFMLNNKKVMSPNDG